MNAQLDVQFRVKKIKVEKKNLNNVKKSVTNNLFKDDYMVGTLKIKSRKS